MITSRLDAYILRYGDFCANDNDDDDTTDYFTPLRSPLLFLLYVNDVNEVVLSEGSKLIL